MLILKKKYNVDMQKKNTLINELSFKNMSLNRYNRSKEKEIATLKRSIEILNSRNANLNEVNIKIHMDHKRLSESKFNLMAKLANDLEAANRKMRIMEAGYKRLEKEKEASVSLYKKYKIKLNANTEAKRQLEKLAYGKEKSMKAVRKYLQQLVTQIGI